MIFAYALGKAQRVLAGLDQSIGPLLMHGAVDRFIPLYRAVGIELPDCCRATSENARETRGRAMVIAPPSAADSPWLRKFGDVATAAVSGWMQIRGTRRWQAVDKGFAISDHADWDGLLSAIDATEAEEIIVTHGYRSVLTRWLAEHGKRASAIATAFEGEMDGGDPDAGESETTERTAQTANDEQ